MERRVWDDGCGTRPHCRTDDYLIDRTDGNPNCEGRRDGSGRDQREPPGRPPRRARCFQDDVRPALPRIEAKLNKLEGCSRIGQLRDPGGDDRRHGSVDAEQLCAVVRRAATKRSPAPNCVRPGPIRTVSTPAACSFLARGGGCAVRAARRSVGHARGGAEHSI